MKNTPALTPSERVRRCEAKAIDAGSRRLNILLSPKGARAYARLMRRRQVSGRELVESLLIEADK
jgi:hypothetical protein